MTSRYPFLHTCIDCRWLDIRTRGGKFIGWCRRRDADVTEDVLIAKACPNFTREAPRAMRNPWFA